MHGPAEIDKIRSGSIHQVDLVPSADRSLHVCWKTVLSKIPYTEAVSEPDTYQANSTIALTILTASGYHLSGSFLSCARRQRRFYLLLGLQGRTNA